MGAEMGFTMKRKIKWKVVVAAGAAVIAVGVIANVVFRYFRYDAYKQFLSSYEVEKRQRSQSTKKNPEISLIPIRWSAIPMRLPLV